MTNARLAIAWMQIRLWATVAAAIVTSLIVGPPIAIWLVARGWRLRRAVRRSLGDLRALVVIGARSESATALTMREQFTADWAAAQRVSIAFVDSARVGKPASLSDAVWKHWRPNAKVPGMSGIVLVRRRGSIVRLSPSITAAATGSVSPASVEAALLRP